MFASIKELVRENFDCYLTADRLRLEMLLAQNFTFTSPYDDHIDRKTYFERCWPIAGTFESLDLQHLVVSENRCFATYDATWKNGNRARNTELFEVSEGQIHSVEVFFGLPSGGSVLQPPAETTKPAHTGTGFDLR